MINTLLGIRLHRALHTVCKWKQVFALWQIGPRPEGDQEQSAVRDHRNTTILHEVQNTAILRILLEKKICTEEELQQTLLEEAEHLSEYYSKKFPGMKATNMGIALIKR